VSRQLGGRFLVIATQNPVEYEGTYPLPEAQLDRFFIKLEVPLPAADVEISMLRRIEAGFDPHHLDDAGIRAVVDVSGVRAARAAVNAVMISDAVMDYLTALIQATRTSPDLLLGASPRASIALLRASKVVAAWSDRDYVIPEDIRDICVPVLRHRLVRRPEAEIQGITEVVAVERAIARVPVPR
jgi:MoxR-like ATPase